MAIKSITTRRLATIDYGVIDIPLIEVSDTLAHIIGNLPFELNVEGVRLSGTVMGANTFPDATHCSISSDTLAFKEYNDIYLKKAENGYTCYIERTATDRFINTFYGGPSSYTGNFCAIIQTADDHYIWGVGLVSATTNTFVDGETMILPNAMDFGYYSAVMPANTHIAITSERITATAQKFCDDLMNISIDSKDDPFGLGGYAGIGGGHGTFSGTGDSISIPSLPTLGAVSTGFITIFNPTASQLADLCSYMWSSSLFDLDTWQKLWADPMDAILGLSIVPVAVPNGGAVPVRVGNISTNVSMNRAGAQYVEVDCGSLAVKEYWGAYLDYDPFTKAEIYLPYIGTRPLSVDDIMNKTVHVVYHVDILSGACCAYVKCDSSVLYTFIGQCSSSIPISGSDLTNVINGVLTAGVSIGSMVATGGMSAPFSLPSLASTAVNAGKPNVEKSGAMSGTGGMMGVQTPYIILTRPRQALPEDQNKYTGYPSFITATLNDLTGYTEIEEIHLEGVPATDAELTEIIQILKGGVIF